MSGSLTAREKPEKYCKIWRLEVCCGTDRNGKRIRHTKTFHGSKKEAKKALAEFSAYWGVGQIEDQTFAGFCDGFVERKSLTLAPSSMRSLGNKIKTLKYIFGEEVMLSKMTPQLIDDAMLELRTQGGPKGKPMKPASVGQIYIQLKAIMNEAVRRNALARDPMPDTQPWSGRPDVRKIPSVEEVRDILKKLDVRNHDQCAVMLAVTLGLRRQEIASLRFEDIDYERNVVKVRRSVQQGADEEIVVDHTKTPSGVRDIPMPSFLPELLEMRKHRLLGDIAFAWRSGLIDEPPEHLYICGNTRGERMSLDAITNWWYRCRAAYGLNCTLHDIRHIFTSMLAANDVHPIVAKELLGHRSISTTLSIYSHPQTNKKVEAMSDLSNMFDL